MLEEKGRRGEEEGTHGKKIGYKKKALKIHWSRSVRKVLKITWLMGMMNDTN